ncbi:hypothetical protein GDO81_004641 [Engystomops pustulosus]|uniref:Secreted protein n=1 Tax=Engystomops pustulosus TaxID=76066 RepID=A0AAV7CHT4_ENGPU|nr:hypothetical protein GDO81_004641 [Engystomops pustulosus]
MWSLFLQPAAVLTSRCLYGAVGTTRDTAAATASHMRVLWAPLGALKSSDAVSLGPNSPDHGIISRRSRGFHREIPGQTKNVVKPSNPLRM